jgi:hypothetical protein
MSFPQVAEPLQRPRERKGLGMCQDPKERYSKIHILLSCLKILVTAAFYFILFLNLVVLRFEPGLHTC